MRLLMVAPELPSPNGKGYQVRLYHQILGLAARHEITLVAFGDEGRLAAGVRAACRRVVAIPWSLPSAGMRAVLGAARLPLSVALYRDRRMSEALHGHALETDLVHVAMVRMAPYLDDLEGRPVVLDLLDSSELNMRERARAATPGASQVWSIEARRLGGYERKAIARVAMALLISQRDFDYLGQPANARVLANGVDPDPFPNGSRRPTTIVFSGTMSYFPNADAATWFAREILPAVQRSFPQAAFRIVGREPTAKVRALASLPGVTVTGPVDDISQEIASAAVAVCPMRYGSGMQTKILEAMAVGTPVVATPKALEGIPADLHRYLRSADTPAAFAREVSQVLAEPQPALRLAGQGLEAIARDHSWQRHVADLESLYVEVVAPARPST
jgi:sugar transferase (PEP-CTERM/EpsH1 system associated)